MWRHLASALPPVADVCAPLDIRLFYHVLLLYCVEIPIVRICGEGDEGGVCRKIADPQNDVIQLMARSRTLCLFVSARTVFVRESI